MQTVTHPKTRGSKSKADYAKRQKRNFWIYPAVVLLIYVVWAGYMTFSGSWDLFSQYWPASLTMVLGSFVAGATAEGGGAVAYPVFTKVLHLASTDARTFSLMIQTFGMGMASLFILTRRIPILPKVILFVSLGGIIGHLLGAFWLVIPGDYPKLLFTFITTAFGIVLFISTYIIKWHPVPKMPVWNNTRKLAFFTVGIFGGIFAAQVGSGIDALTFMVLTLAFGIDEKISTPTTVVIMAINSLVGFLLHGLVLQDIGQMWNYWLVAVEVVILGAPFGAYVISKAPRHMVINFLLFLIVIELITTLILLPITDTTQRLVTGGAVAVFGFFFWALLRYRHRHLPASEQH
jgi:uncharacterized membrane protein YfcA